MDQRQAAGLAGGIDELDPTCQLLPVGACPYLDTDWIFYAADVFDMSALGLIGAESNPRKMSGEVEKAGAPRDSASLRLFVAEVEGFMGSEEVDAVALAGTDAEDVLHEDQGVGNGARHPMVLVGHRGVLDPIEIEVLGVMKVGKAAFDEGPDEVQGERGALVAAQQELRIGGAAFEREVGPVDDIAAVGGEGDAAAGLFIGGARLRVLSCEAA